MDRTRACSWMTFCMQTCSVRRQTSGVTKLCLYFCLSNPTENGKSHYRSENICSLLYAKSLQYIKTWSCQICFYKQTIKWHIQFWTFFLFKKMTTVWPNNKNKIKKCQTIPLLITVYHMQTLVVQRITKLTVRIILRILSHGSDHFSDQQKKVV